MWILEKRPKSTVPQNQPRGHGPRDADIATIFTYCRKRNRWRVLRHSSDRAEDIAGVFKSAVLVLVPEYEKASANTWWPTIRWGRSQSVSQRARPLTWW